MLYVFAWATHKNSLTPLRGLFPRSIALWMMIRLDPLSVVTSSFTSELYTRLVTSHQRRRVHEYIHKSWNERKKVGTAVLFGVRA